MRHRVATIVTSVLLAAVVVGSTTPATPQDKGPRERPGPGGRFPHVQAAMHHLKQAAQQLERAEPVFGGHRAKALELVKQAEQELRAAVEYARAHQPAKKPEGAGKTQ